MRQRQQEIQTITSWIFKFDGDSRGREADVE
jgi:hypothetical protein